MSVHRKEKTKPEKGTNRQTPTRKLSPFVIVIFEQTTQKNVSFVALNG
jgi:hypothetical protein